MSNLLIASNNLSEIGASITTYYGGGVTVHYQSTTDLVFSGSALSDKYLRFAVASNRVAGSYSGSIASGSALVSPVTFMPNYSAGTVSNTYFLLCPNMIFVTQLLTTLLNKIGFAGRMNSGEYIVYGSQGNSNNTYAVNGRIINTSVGLDVGITPHFYGGVKTTTNKYIMARPTFIHNISGISMYSGSAAYIPDLYICTVGTANNEVYSGSGIFVSPGGAIYIDTNYSWNGIGRSSNAPFLIRDVVV